MSACWRVVVRVGLREDGIENLGKLSKRFMSICNSPRTSAIKVHRPRHVEGHLSVHLYALGGSGVVTGNFAGKRPQLPPPRTI